MSHQRLSGIHGEVLRAPEMFRIVGESRRCGESIAMGVLVGLLGISIGTEPPPECVRGPGARVSAAHFNKFGKCVVFLESASLGGHLPTESNFIPRLGTSHGTVSVSLARNITISGCLWDGAAREHHLCEVSDDLVNVGM
jgi:hypothetical protein